ncbi:MULTISPECIES: hypothetical protein [Bradyrhizobium]
MVDKRIINRIYRSHNLDSRIVEEAIKVSGRAFQLLRDNPAPDTFIGRKTQEPFPQEENRYGWTEKRAAQRHFFQASPSQVARADRQVEEDQAAFGKEGRAAP